MRSAFSSASPTLISCSRAVARRAARVLSPRPRVGVVALEIEDVADIGATPAEDGLIVVAHDRQVLLEPREVAKQHVLGTVRVLILVDENVLVAVLPFLERPVTRLEHSAGKKQQVVEVDRIVLAEELVVPLPHNGGDPIQLAFGVRRKIGRALELVLSARDHGRDGPRGENALAGVGVAHGLAEHRPLVGFVVDRERTVDPDDRALAPKEAGAEAMKSSHGELGKALL